MDLGFGALTVMLAGLYLLFKCISFIRFYIIGRRSNFPIYVTPVFSKSVIWIVLGPALQPQLRKYLPRWIYERLDIVIHGWEFRRKAEMHQRLGKVFALVSPDECSLWVADPILGSVILKRRKDFVQPPFLAQLLGFFGSNLLLANGEDWHRQRRIITLNLHEGIMTTVWNKSCEQAQAMVDFLIKHPGGQTLEGLRSVSINVLGQAGYGQNQLWSPNFAADLGDDWEGPRIEYFKTIALVTDRFLEAALVPAWLKELPFMPQYLQLLARKMRSVPGYIKEILEDERKTTSVKESKHRSNLLDMLVQFANPENKSASPGLFLSEDEISGNLWIFTAAGFDTTANTMGYAVALLAAYPEWQDWIREELRALDSDVCKWKYETVFPQCQRTLALMFETLRLFTPVLHSTRFLSEPQQVTDADGDHLLSPPMDVFVAAQSIHSNPEIWGADVAEFKPSRWLDSTGQLIIPEKGTYLPWSSGPRICPGMKMAQVEFVATFATLFRHANCETIQIGQETPEEARSRLLNLMAGSISKLTLQVKDSRQVQLRWIPNV